MHTSPCVSASYRFCSAFCLQSKTGFLSVSQHVFKCLHNWHCYVLCLRKHVQYNDNILGVNFTSIIRILYVLFAFPDACWRF